MVPYCVTKRRTSNGSPTDFISNLPADIIHNILKRLSLRDAARLGILSRTWLDIWISLPYLKFDMQFFKEVLSMKQFQAVTFDNIMSKVLLSHNGPVSQFVLDIPDVDLASGLEIGQAFRFLSNNNVKEIFFTNHQKSTIKLPSPLFSCTKLEHVKLRHCTFSVPPTYRCFNNLSHLELYNVGYIGDDIGGFISTCPELRILILEGLTGVNHLSIHKPSLLIFHARGNFMSICLKGCTSLSGVSIGFQSKLANDHQERARDLIKFLSGLSNLTKLFLLDFSVEFFNEACIGKRVATTFKHLKELQLGPINSASQITFQFALRLILNCPNVEGLVLYLHSNHSHYTIDFPKTYTFQRLRIVNIHLSNAVDKELSLMEFILARAPLLEKYIVRLRKSVEACSRSRLSKELLRFRRASTKAEVILQEL